ncbi:retrovirus-related pol polyprotein from transposon TNT 1-94 [Tanacetum coccineum]
MMNLTTLPKSFWGYALKFAVRILNMVPTKKVERTPYEIWHGKAPKLSYLRVWGCEALVKRDTPDKLDSKSIKYIFVGYPKETIGYYFYYPLKNKIFVSRNDEFFENSFMVQEASESHKLLKMSGSDKGLEIIQEEDTQPSENTSKEHNEVAPIEVEPQTIGVLIRRLMRNLAFARHLEEIHMTWVHLEKKRTRLRTYTNISQDYVLRGCRRRHKMHLTPSKFTP